jgi:hypothetical protein
VLEAYIRCDYEKRGSAVMAQGLLFGGEGKKRSCFSTKRLTITRSCVDADSPAAQAGRAVDPRRDPRYSDAENGAHPRDAEQRCISPTARCGEVVEGQVNIEDMLNPTVGGVVRVKQPGMIREIPSGAGQVMASRGDDRIFDDPRAAHRLDPLQPGHGRQLAEQDRDRHFDHPERLDAAGRARRAAVAEFLRDLQEAAEAGLDARRTRPRSSGSRRMGRDRPARMENGFDMIVAVGLGTGNKDQMIAHLTNLLEIDSRLSSFRAAPTARC